MSDLNEQLEQLQAEEPDVMTESIPLLWFIRRVLEQEELDSYEYVFEEPKIVLGVPFDAAFLAESEGESGAQTVNLIQITSETDAAVIEDHASTSLEHLSSPSSTGGTQAVKDIVLGLGLTTRRKLDPASTNLRLIVLAPNASVGASDEESDGLELQVYDADRLDQLARAISAPSAKQGTITVLAEPMEILETPIDAGTVFVCPVAAADIVQWPGIDDRTLFDLNVRLKLGAKRVRQSLEAGIREATGAGDFIAGHNGITVVCDDVKRVTGGLEITNFSVVNGTQSVIAFYENRADLNPHTRVLAKFAAVGTTRQIAREIAIRSNTQNPVTSRNLRALDLTQLRIAGDFAEHYPDFSYVIRPGTELPAGTTGIQNDDAAQLLCAIYNQKPWLAVKRQVLFEQPHYRQIFNDRVGAAEIILCYQVMEAIQRTKSAYPDEYLRTWKLTSLVAAYLAGQVLRVNDHLAEALRDPAAFVRLPDLEFFNALSHSAARVLNERADRFRGTDVDDDFKVEFKREGPLKELAGAVRSQGLVPISAA